LTDKRLIMKGVVTMKKRTKASITICKNPNNPAAGYTSYYLRSIGLIRFVLKWPKKCDRKCGSTIPAGYAALLNINTKNICCVDHVKDIIAELENTIEERRLWLQANQPNKAISDIQRTEREKREEERLSISKQYLQNRWV